MPTVDYFLVFDEGYLDKNVHKVYRAKCSTDKGTIDKLGEVRLFSGFGTTQDEAVKNFIHNNDPRVLDKIFNL